MKAEGRRQRMQRREEVKEEGGKRRKVKGVGSGGGQRKVRE